MKDSENAFLKAHYDLIRERYTVNVRPATIDHLMKGSNERHLMETFV